MANRACYLGVQTPAVPASAPADGEENDAEICFICASPIQHTAVTPCNHRTCHICSLRLRALYKVKTCAHCRVSEGYLGEVQTSDTTVDGI
jgi:hypothetical protein